MMRPELSFRPMTSHERVHSGPTVIKPAKVPRRHHLKTEDVTSPSGSRIVDIGHLQAALDTVQQCGHSSLVLLDAPPNTGKRCTLWANYTLVCRVCQNGVGFSNGPLETYKISKLDNEIRKLIGDDFHEVLVRYFNILKVRPFVFRTDENPVIADVNNLNPEAAANSSDLSDPLEVNPSESPHLQSATDCSPKEEYANQCHVKEGNVIHNILVEDPSLSRSGQNELPPTHETYSESPAPKMQQQVEECKPASSDLEALSKFIKEEEIIKEEIVEDINVFKTEDCFEPDVVIPEFSTQDDNILQGLGGERNGHQVFQNYVISNSPMIQPQSRTNRIDTHQTGNQNNALTKGVEKENNWSQQYLKYVISPVSPMELDKQSETSTHTSSTCLLELGRIKDSIKTKGYSECPKCTKAYMSSTGALNHWKKCEGILRDGDFIACKICHARFGELRFVQSHMRKNH